MAPRASNSAGWLVERGVKHLARVHMRSRALDGGGFDLCHIHLLDHYVDPWSLGRAQKRCPLISTVHDVVPHETRLPSAVERGLLRRLYAQAGHIVVAHQYLRTALTEKFGVDPQRVDVVPLPLHDVSGVREDAAREEDSFNVLFFGTFRRNKGLDVLLEAIDMLSGHGQLRFRIVGRGHDELERRVGAVAARDHRVTAEIGHASDRRRDELYREASIVVLPYTAFASQSGVLRDAYSYRVPVVVTDVGALGHTVREDGAGWVVRPADPRGLADAFLEAYEDRQRRSRISSGLSDLVSERSVTAVGTSLRAIYERVGGES